jgi:hypothetical protein
MSKVQATPVADTTRDAFDLLAGMLRTQVELEDLTPAAAATLRAELGRWLEQNPDDSDDWQVCPRLFQTFGMDHARRMTDLLVDLTGHGCPCTDGGRCLFRPAAYVTA